MFNKNDKETKKIYESWKDKYGNSKKKILSEKNIYKSMGIHMIINNINNENIIKTSFQGVKGIFEMSYVLNYIVRIFVLYKLYLQQDFNQYKKLNIDDIIIKKIKKIQIKKQKKVKISKEEGRISLLKNADNNLFNFKVEDGRRVYSRLCQLKQQPIVLSEKEVNEENKKSEKEKKYAYILKYKNYTKEDSFNYYTCDLSSKHKYIGFLANKQAHPKEYCLPCCQKKSSIDEPKQSNYKRYKECLGKDNEEINEERDIGKILYVMKLGAYIPKNRLGKLHPELDIILNKNLNCLINNNNMLQNKSECFLQYGVEQNEIALQNCLEVILDKSYDDIISESITFMKQKKIFRFLNNGQFLVELNNGEIFKENISENKIKKLQNSYISLLNEKNINIYYIWSLIRYTHNLTIVFFKENENKQIELVNPQPEYSNNKKCMEVFDEFFPKKNKLCFIIQTNENRFYPIIKVKVSKIRNKGNITTYEKIFDQKEIFFKQIEKIYKKIWFIKSKYNYHHTGKELYYVIQNNDSLNNKYKIISQNVDLVNQCVNIIIKHKKGVSFNFPVYPRGPIYNLNITNKKLYKYSPYLLEFFDDLSNYTSNTTKYKIDKIILTNNKNICGILLNTQFYVYFEKNNDFTKLLKKYKNNVIEQIYDSQKLDLDISLNNKNRDNREKNIEIIKYYQELYNLYCIEISKFINKEKNNDLRKKIINLIIQKDNNKKNIKEYRKKLYILFENKYVTQNDKNNIEEIFDLQISLKEKINYIESQNYDFDRKIKKNLIDLLSSKKIEIKKIETIIKDISDKVIHLSNKKDIFKIDNNRNSCFEYNKKKCDEYDHCYWNKKDCKLFVNKTINDYLFRKFIDEITSNEIKQYEILNDKLEQIIDKSKYINPNNEYNIYQIPNKNVKKLKQKQMRSFQLQ
jgi:hypothetical protein